MWTHLAQASHLSFIISRNQFMWSFLYLTVMPMQALVSVVWARPEVKLTHTVFPGWHLNPVGFKRCSVNFYIHVKKEREVIFCFYVIALSFTFSIVFWKLSLYASGFIGVLWLSLFNFFSWAQSIPHMLFHCSQRERCCRSPLSSLVCDGSLSPATAHATFLWATLLLSTSSLSLKIQKHALLPILFEKIKALIFFPKSSFSFLENESKANHCGFLKTNINYSINMAFVELGEKLGSLEVISSLIIKWDWDISDLICSFGDAPFNGGRVSHSEQNQLLALPKFSLVQSWVTAPFSAPREWGLVECPCWGLRDGAQGKAQEGFRAPAALMCPWAQPIEKQHMGQRDPKRILVTTVQVLRPLQHPPSFIPECTKSMLSRWVVSGRNLTHPTSHSYQDAAVAQVNFPAKS